MLTIHNFFESSTNPISRTSRAVRSHFQRHGQKYRKAAGTTIEATGKASSFAGENLQKAGQKVKSTKTSENKSESTGD
ncbi:MAG: hypothetical protein ACOC22_04000 [bacterium]